MDGVAASERDRLPVQGFSGTPEEIERSCVAASMCSRRRRAPLLESGRRRGGE
jgi:hypothetical protein